MDVLFLMRFFRLYPRLILTFEHNSARKNLFSSACFCWDSRLSLREMDQKFKFGGTIGYDDSFWSSYFVISKYSDYIQYYMMLQEQYRRIVVKGLATATWLDEDQSELSWDTWLGYSFSLRKTLSADHFQLQRVLKQYVQHFSRYWAVSWKRYWGVGIFNWWDYSGTLISSCKKVQTQKASLLM